MAPEMIAEIGNSQCSQEKEMATHSSTRAWKIPWTEEPDRPQSMELDTTKQLSYLLTASVCTHTLVVVI